MVNNSAQFDDTFLALSDGTRRAIIQRLAKGPATVGELAAPFAMSAPAISKHLRILERAGLMRRRKQGRIHWCTLDPEPMQSAAEWIHQQRALWNGMLDNLEQYLKREAREEIGNDEDHGS